MKRRSSQGFTLVEILTVIVIILIIAAWTISAYGPGSAKAARSRAQAEIQVLSTACESYKADFGSYPRLEGTTEQKTGGTPPIDPKADGNPLGKAYQAASIFLYVSLSGDTDMNGKINDDEPKKAYLNFEKTMLGATKDASGAITKVNYIQDPFGNSYGYSTAAARTEDDFKDDIAKNGANAKRSDKMPGFNTTFDLWSTGGKILSGSAAPVDADRVKWIKNW